MHKIKDTILLAALLVPLFVSGCASATPTPAPLTLDALKNAEYQSEFAANKKVKLTNGVYQEDLAPGAASKLSIRLLDQYAIGDLDGEGGADAAVILAANTGGSGTFVTLEAVIDAGGVPKHAASTQLGDRTQVKSISINQREIVLELITHAPSDPLCCPTLRVTKKFKLQGGALVRAD